MIHAVTPEETWLPRLRDVPALTVDPQALLVVAPHPDDETLGAGGLIASLRHAGVPVIVVAVTDGDAAYDGVPGLAAIRTQEQEAALSRLGVETASIVRLGLPDRFVGRSETALAERLASLVTPGALLLAPWTGDYHPDHEACGRAALVASARTGAPLLGYFFWTWHRGTPADLDDLRLCRFDLTPELVAQRHHALAAHASQLGTTFGEPIVPPDLLGPLDRRFEVFARA